MKSLLIFTIVLIVISIALSPAARAEEDEAGHYFPGALSSFVSLLPDRDSRTFAYANLSTFYHGSGDLQFPGGSTKTKATSYTNASVFLEQFQPIPMLLNGQYAAALAVPYTWLKVDATLSLGHTKIRSHDKDNGFGDIEMFPLMMGWHKGDWKYQTEFGIYMPTGNFTKGDLANVGRNYWTFEPSAAISYFSLTTGFEFTASAGFDFNTKNGATHYQSGDQFHLDGTLAEHFLLPGQRGDLAGLGVAGFFYQQITGDGGHGAMLGGFEAMTTGIGPVVSYVYPVGDSRNAVLAGEVQWLPELSVSNRLSGNIVWFKAVLSWGSERATNPIQAL